MNLNELTLGQIKEIKGLMGSTCNEQRTPYEVGKNYLIRTVTHYQVGKVKAVYPKELVLENASWIADTGRFHDCLKNGEFSEVEPFVNDVIVNISAIVDATPWDHKLPKDQK